MNGVLGGMTQKNPARYGNPATLRPGDGANNAGEPFYEGHDISRAGMMAIYSVGATAREAVEAFCLARMGMPMEQLGAVLDTDGDSRFDWGYRFTVDGTGCKAAGINVPGGKILTWWK